MINIPVTLILPLLMLLLNSSAQPSSAHSLGFSVYTNVSMLPTFETLYSNANASDLVIDDCWCSGLPYLSHWNSPQSFPRMILANNISELNSYMIPLAKQYGFGSRDYVAYDVEDWSLTPLTEQKDIVSDTQLACEDVHSAGYQFAFTPEIDVPGWYGLTDFPEINWTCVNFLDLQEQSYSNNPSSLTKNVTQLLGIAKGDNPNLTVFVQIDVSGDSTSASQSQIETDITDLSKINGVNGVILQDLCTSSQCNSELVTLVSFVNSFALNVTVLPTTSTTTSSTTSSTSTALSTSTVNTTVSTSFLTTSLNTTTILPVFNDTTFNSTASINQTNSSLANDFPPENSPVINSSSGWYPLLATTTIPYCFEYRNGVYRSPNGFGTPCYVNVTSPNLSDNDGLQNNSTLNGTILNQSTTFNQTNSTFNHRYFGSEGRVFGQGIHDLKSLSEWFSAFWHR